MSKPKNRCVTNSLVHYVKRGGHRRRQNYHVQQCNAVVVYNVTDQAMALTCIICIAKEQRDQAQACQR